MDARDRAAEIAAEIVATERLGMDLPDIFWGGLQVQIETAIDAHTSDLESQLAASQERVAELEREYGRTRKQIERLKDISRRRRMELAGTVKKLFRAIARADTAERERDEARQELSRARELIDPGPLPPTDREWLEAKITFETERADAATCERDEAVARAEEAVKALRLMYAAWDQLMPNLRRGVVQDYELVCTKAPLAAQDVIRKADDATRPDPARSDAGGEETDR